VNAASKADLPVVAFAPQADWNAWLAGQPKASLGVRVKFAKKASAVSQEGLGRVDSVETGRNRRRILPWLDRRPAE
jgi:hypothetical protein